MKSDIKVVGKWNVKGMRNVGNIVNVKKKKKWLRFYKEIFMICIKLKH